MNPVTALRRIGNGQRRSQRLPLQVPVCVYGRAADNNLFRETTNTLSVNAHGGLLALTASVNRDQAIFVLNITAQEARACRVVYIGQEQDGKREVGIEFLRVAPHFWEVDFPPANPH